MTLLDATRPRTRGAGPLLTVGIVVALIGFISRDPASAAPPSSSTLGQFVPVPTTRVFDSGAANVGSTPVVVNIAGSLVPSTASAVVINTEVYSPTAAGYVRVTPAHAQALVATQEFAKGQSISNLGTIKLADGQVQVSVSAGKARILMDVSGYYTDEPSASGASRFTPLTTTRIFDSGSASVGTAPVAVSIAGHAGGPGRCNRRRRQYRGLPAVLGGVSASHSRRHGQQCRHSRVRPRADGVESRDRGSARRPDPSPGLFGDCTGDHGCVRLLRRDRAVVRTPSDDQDLRFRYRERRHHADRGTDRQSRRRTGRRHRRRRQRRGRYTLGVRLSASHPLRHGQRGCCPGIRVWAIDLQPGRCRAVRWQAAAQGFGGPRAHPARRRGLRHEPGECARGHEPAATSTASARSPTPPRRARVAPTRAPDRVWCCSRSAPRRSTRRCPTPIRGSCSSAPTTGTATPIWWKRSTAT